jgi:RNA polymerase sigma factor (TIGR02999 family)
MHAAPSMSQATHDVTQLLTDWSNGDNKALDRLTPLVYAELRRLANHYLRREQVNHTLQPTALVHEAYLRLVDQSVPDWKNRSHFFGVAAKLMRQILVDHARGQRAAKRDGGHQVPLSDTIAIAKDRSADLVELDGALNELERIDARKTRIVELRFFAGLSVEETARVMDLSVATVYRETRMAETWLYRKLSPDPA